MTSVVTPICGLSRDDFLKKIEAFHGFTAPGLVIGGLMVDEAQELVRINMGPGIDADVIVESKHCLPDAVQIFTPCTIGNGWLKILDWGKFALSLYNKNTMDGYRVWFDVSKASEFPNLYNWYMKKVSKKDLPIGILLESIFEAGKSVLSSRAVSIKNTYSGGKKGDTKICADCDEAYPVTQGEKCLSCQGESYYKF
jgi:formylmethanofuran dehydrogenase subunit E